MVLMGEWSGLQWYVWIMRGQTPQHLGPLNHMERLVYGVEEQWIPLALYEDGGL